MNFKLTAICIFMLLSLGAINAQEAATASGGEASGSGGSVSYSLGQVSYSTVESSSGTITEGVQQPYEIFVIVALENSGSIDLQLSTYPNPATDKLFLTVENQESQNISYQMFDLQGRLLLTAENINGVEEINMSNLVPAAYLLRVYDNSQEIKTFKIIKK